MVGFATLVSLITNGILWFNDKMAEYEPLPTVVRNYTTQSSTTKQTTEKTVIRLPSNIDHLPLKIKKILNISRGFIEISEYCDEMIEYNNHIIR